MVKKYQHLFLFVFFLSCQETSIIENEVRPRKMIDKYGDGNHYIQNIFIPIKNSELSYEDNFPQIPIIGKVTRFIGDTLVANTKEGKMLVSYNSSIPQIPLEITSIKLKDFFLFIRPNEKIPKQRSKLGTYLSKKKEATFNFLKKFSFKFSSHPITSKKQRLSPLIPYLKDQILDKKLDSSESKELLQNSLKEGELIFHDLKHIDLKKIQADFFENDLINSQNKNHVVISYHQDHAYEANNNSYLENYHLIETQKPLALRSYLQTEFSSLFDKLMVFENLLVVRRASHLKEHSLYFLRAMMEDQYTLDFYEITQSTQCNPSICLTIEKNETNLVDLMRGRNNLEILSFIEAWQVPPSFKLDGYTEFELKTHIDF